MSNRARRLALLPFLALLIALAVDLLIVDGDQAPERDRVVVELEGRDDVPAGVPAGPAELPLNVPAQEALENVEEAAGGHPSGEPPEADGDFPPADLADETPPGLPPAAGEELPLYLERNAERNDLPDLSPLAAPQQDGCRTRLVGNRSSRNGVRPRVLVAHYTVSRNRPGFADVDAITAYFNNRASSASSHYVIDAVGNCNLIVPETAKAWTQAAGNPYSIAVEHIAYGDEADLATAAGYRRAGRIYADAGRRWRIPIQRGAIDRRTCRPTRAGIVQHADFGACGGGHHDIGPFEPRERALGKLISAARSSRSSSAPSRTVRRWCHHVNVNRARERRGSTTPAQRSHARRHLRDLERRGYRCTSRGPVRR